MGVKFERHRMTRIVEILSSSLPRTGHVMGVDPSFRSTGIVVLDPAGEIVLETSIGTTRAYGNEAARCAYLYDGFCEIFEAHPVETVVSERVTSSKNFSGIRGVVFAEALMLAALFRNNEDAVHLTLVPSQLKKIGTGNGGAKKNMVLKGVFQRYGADLENDDIADAYCAALAARWLPTFVDEVMALLSEVADSDRDQFLLDFDNLRTYDETSAIPNVEMYDVFKSVCGSMETLRTVNPAAVSELREEMEEFLKK